MLLGAVVSGIGIPWLATRMLMASLTHPPSKPVINYRGADVFHGLGTVWLVWSFCAVAAGWIGPLLAASPLWSVLEVGGVIAAFAFAAGVVDDAYGTGDSRGFRGHLRQLARGRLSTGGLKIIVIGLVSLGASGRIASLSRWGGSQADSADARVLFGIVVAGAAIALTANLLNLLDLRPGRALKAYCALTIPAVLGVATLLGGSAVGSPAFLGVVVAVLLLGPVGAVWGYDLGEKSMLGDAGANAMGAVVGVFVVAGLPLWGLVAYAVIVLALNLVSERVSFTRVIEGNAVLHRLDRIGRIPE
jgi:hypothetical protein